MNRPLQIGVTGGIGSGKSLVCRIFSVLSVPVYNADHQARWLMNNDEPLKRRIKETFGDEAFQTDGQINRAYLAGRVFDNEVELKKLNALVHPAVGKDYAQWVSGKKDKSYVIKEAALMFESGSYKALDYIINVSAPVEVRIRRVLKRDPFRKREEVEAIIDKQLSEDERIRRSDFIIQNDDQEMILPRIVGLHHHFLSLKNPGASQKSNS